MRQVSLLIALVCAFCLMSPQPAKADALNPCTYSTIKEALWSLSTITTVQLVTATTNPTTYTTICASMAESNANDTLTLFYGTGTLCGTGSVNLESLTMLSGTTWTNNLYSYQTIPPGNNICLSSSTAQVNSGHISYVQTVNPF